MFILKKKYDNKKIIISQIDKINIIFYIARQLKHSFIWFKISSPSWNFPIIRTYLHFGHTTICVNNRQLLLLCPKRIYRTCAHASNLAQLRRELFLVLVAIPAVMLTSFKE